MTNLRPGLGSCTPNWGINDDRDLRDCLLRLDLACLAAAHVGPHSDWIGPQAGDRRSSIEPKGVRPRLHQHRLGTDGKDCCGSTTECRLTEAGAMGSQATPKAHAGLDSRGAGRVARSHPLGAELVVLRYRFVGTERFLRRDVQHFSGKRNEGRSGPGMGTCRGLTS
jgi:hypothetical protein